MSSDTISRDNVSYFNFSIGIIYETNSISNVV